MIPNARAPNQPSIHACKRRETHVGEFDVTVDLALLVDKVNGHYELLEHKPCNVLREAEAEERRGDRPVGHSRGEVSSWRVD